jgi:hypothetical protein
LASPDSELQRSSVYCRDYYLNQYLCLLPAIWVELFSSAESLERTRLRDTTATCLPQNQMLASSESGTLSNRTLACPKRASHYPKRVNTWTFGCGKGTMTMVVWAPCCVELELGSSCFGQLRCEYVIVHLGHTHKRIHGAGTPSFATRQKVRRYATMLVHSITLVNSIWFLNVDRILPCN